MTCHFCKRATNPRGTCCIQAALHRQLIQTNRLRFGPKLLKS